MASNDNIKLDFTEENVRAAQAILDDIKQQAEKAHEDNDLFTMSILTELLKVASPIIVRAQARLEREEKARINKKHKDLKSKAREQKASSTAT